MTENLHGIARGVEGIVSLESGDLVVDIGCNDGTLLDGYQTEGLRYLGFDPSDVGALRDREGVSPSSRTSTRRRGAAGAGAPTRRRRRSRASRCSTTSSTRARSSPTSPQSLAERGIWVIELHYLPMMLGSQRVRRDRPRAPRVLLARGDRAAGRRGGPGGRSPRELNDINGGSIRPVHRALGRRTADARAGSRR